VGAQKRTCSETRVIRTSRNRHALVTGERGLERDGVEGGGLPAPVMENEDPTAMITSRAA
jgi:hypothetical protein